MRMRAVELATQSLRKLISQNSPLIPNRERSINILLRDT
jgi:hypothetical protein